MRKVGLKTLKNKLSEYVRFAAAGETVVITDRGRPVAEIVPPRREPEHESVIERGIREGWIRPAVRGPNWPPQGKPVPGLTFEKLMEDLASDRENRW
jgi:prevent-host-death family protein